jgi:hypothetical protein
MGKSKLADTIYSRFRLLLDVRCRSEELGWDYDNPMVSRGLRIVSASQPLMDEDHALTSTSGFYPGVIFYLTLFYKRTELAGRLGAFFAAGAIANGFTGLIAYGVRTLALASNVAHC